MSWFRPKSWLDRFYEAGIIIKGVDGVLELIGGFLLLIVSSQTLNRIVVTLTQHELAEDPRDFVATHLLSAGQHLASGGTGFAVAYLWLHGLTKVVLVFALLRNKLWAYPPSLVVLVLFILYQIYRIGYSHSVGLTLLTLFDMLVVWLVWREYQQQRSRMPA